MEKLADDLDDVLEIASRTVQAAIERSERQSATEDTAALVQRAIAEGKDPAAVLLGRRGGLRGGRARSAKMTPEERRASALKAARARWGKPGKS